MLYFQKLQNNLQIKIKPQTSNVTARLSQKSLLGIGIKRKNGEKKPCVADSSKQVKLDNYEGKPENIESKSTANQVKDIKDLHSIEPKNFDKGQFQCVAVLPGLGPYNDSSDSEISTGSDDEPQGCEDHGKYDLVGRKHLKKKHGHD